jgi:hypothetical protein
MILRVTAVIIHLNIQPALYPNELESLAIHLIHRVIT